VSDFNPPEPGLYILTETIKNPIADKRFKRKLWAVPEFVKGAKFKVERSGAESLGDGTLIEEFTITPLGGKCTDRKIFGRLYNVKGNQNFKRHASKFATRLAPLLIPLLSPVTEKTFEDIWSMRDKSIEDPGRPILKLLVQDGILSLEDIEGLLDRHRDLSLYDEIGERDD